MANRRGGEIDCKVVVVWEVLRTSVQLVNSASSVSVRAHQLPWTDRPPGCSGSGLLDASEHQSRREQDDVGDEDGQERVRE